MRSAADLPRSPAAMVVLVVVATCAVALGLGYANKARCAGPEFTDTGRSAPDFGVRIHRDVCYSDIQLLWIGRGISDHLVPYFDAHDPSSMRGTVEYPVLTGMLIWLGSLGVRTDSGFLAHSALLLAPFGLLAAAMLAALSRWRALLWSLTPPLVLYAFLNWDLAAVACTVTAIWLVEGARAAPEDLARPRGRRSWWPSLRRPRPVAAAVMLGLGAAFKLYPGAFVLPLMLAVFAGLGEPSQRHAAGRAVRALGVGLAAVLTVLAVNLPFVLFGYTGWRNSILFQTNRQLDVSTNSIWYWGLRPVLGDRAGELASVASPILILAAFLLACVLGWRRYRREGRYPWLAVSASMLCGFLLLHTVHSPQYVLWLLPFFVLLRVHWGWIAAYLVADALLGVGIFRWFYDLRSAAGYDITTSLAGQAVVLGVWGRAALLAVLFFVFLRANSAISRA